MSDELKNFTDFQGAVEAAVHSLRINTRACRNFAKDPETHIDENLQASDDRDEEVCRQELAVWMNEFF